MCVGVGTRTRQTCWWTSCYRSHCARVFLNPLTPRHDVWAARGCPGPLSYSSTRYRLSAMALAMWGYFPAALNLDTQALTHISTSGDLPTPIYMRTWSLILVLTAFPSSPSGSIDFPRVSGLSWLWGRYFSIDFSLNQVTTRHDYR